MTPPQPDEPPLSSEHQGLLLEVARKSILHGLERHSALTLDARDYPPELREPRAVFVTLLIEEELRGCIGTLEASRPLVENVAHYAHAAAFADGRFPALTSAEFPDLELKLSMLSPLEPLVFASEAELLAQLRPGVDGLVIEDDYHRGTFLPSVWESLPEPHAFWTRLKAKAGLPPDYWSATLRASRYTAFGFGGPAVEG